MIRRQMFDGGATCTAKDGRARHGVAAMAVLAVAILGAGPASAQDGHAEVIDAATGTTGATVVVPVVVSQVRPKAVLTQAQRWLYFTTKSKQTLDLNGVQASLYRGKFYRAQLETKRRCIVRRESNGHYFSISHNGYRGAYQMSAALARGVTWMMLPEHRQILGDEAAREVLAQLRETPANKWPRYWQDAAFSTIHNWEYTGSGASHWYGGRWHCS